METNRKINIFGTAAGITAIVLSCLSGNIAGILLFAGATLYFGVQL